MGFLAPLIAPGAGLGAGLTAAAAPAAGAGLGAAAGAAGMAAAPQLGGMAKLFNSPMMSDVGHALTAANQPGQATQLPQQRPVQSFRELLPQLIGEVGANYLGKLA